MPNITNNETVQAIAREYCSNGLKKVEALVEAGYSESYARAIGLKLYDNVALKQAIEGIEAQKQAVSEHNYDTAVQMLRQRITWLDAKAEAGDTQAIQAQTAIIRELDCITGLQKQNIQQTGAGLTINVTEAKPKEAYPKLQDRQEEA